MLALIRTTFGGGGGNGRLLARATLLVLLAAALLTILALAPAAADGDPGEFDLALSIVDDSDNIVPPGSEFIVQADLRFPWELPITPPAGLPSYTAYALSVPAASVVASNLRISGNLEWDSAGRRRLDIAAQQPLYSRITSAPGGTQQIAKALDGRTLITRTDNELLLIFDSYTLEHKATISRPAPPAATTTGSAPSARSRSAVSPAPPWPSGTRPPTAPGCSSAPPATAAGWGGSTSSGWTGARMA